MPAYIESIDRLLYYVSICIEKALTMVNQTSGLRYLREEKLLTQQELAVQAGLTVTTISRIETGKVTPNLRTIRAIAMVLDYNPQELKHVLESSLKGYPPQESKKLLGLIKLGRTPFRRK